MDTVSPSVPASISVRVRLFLKRDVYFAPFLPLVFTNYVAKSQALHWPTVARGLVKKLNLQIASFRLFV